MGSMYIQRIRKRRSSMGLKEIIGRLFPVGKKKVACKKKKGKK
jgi:hypothetical protein